MAVGAYNGTLPLHAVGNSEGLFFSDGAAFTFLIPQIQGIFFLAAYGLLSLLDSAYRFPIGPTGALAQEVVHNITVAIPTLREISTVGSPVLKYCELTEIPHIRTVCKRATAVFQNEGDRAFRLFLQGLSVDDNTASLTAERLCKQNPKSDACTVARINAAHALTATIHLAQAYLWGVATKQEREDFVEKVLRASVRLSPKAKAVFAKAYRHIKAGDMASFLGSSEGLAGLDQQLIRCLTEAQNACARLKPPACEAGLNDCLYLSEALQALSSQSIR